MRWLDGITDSMDMSLSGLRADHVPLEAINKELDMTEQLNGTELN